MDIFLPIRKNQVFLFFFNLAETNKKPRSVQVSSFVSYKKSFNINLDNIQRD